MKVALISQEGGGISSVSIGLGLSLARKKIETTIFTSESTFGKVAPITDKINDYLEIIRLPVPDMPPRNLWFHFFHSAKFLKLQNQFDIVHGVSPFSSVGYTFLSRRSRRPLVSTLHTSQRKGLETLLHQPLSSLTTRDIGLGILEFPLHYFSEKRILQHSDHTVICSYTLFEELSAYRKTCLEGASVIQNGVDFNEIEKIGYPSAKDQENISIVFAGRLFPSKGVMYLLEAFKLLRRVSKNVQLKIFGKGPLEERIGRFIAESNLEDCVSNFGRIPHEKLLAEIKNSDIAVLPSIQEAQSMFMLETMACKKPLIAFDLPFAREIMKNMETGILTKPWDILDLYKKIELLVSDEKLRNRLGETAYDYVLRHHNWDIQVEKYLKVYDSVIH